MENNDQWNNEGYYQDNHKLKPFEYGYFNMGLHVVLLLFTCGIWWMIWVYRTTNYLNRLESEPRQTPICQLLLNFIPFYYIYWTYKNAERIDKYARQNNIYSDITVASTILAIFIYIIAEIIMQAKINEIVRSKDTRYYTYQNANPGGYTYQNANPGGYTYQNANPGGYNYQNANPGGYTYQNANPGTADAEGQFRQYTEDKSRPYAENQSRPYAEEEFRSYAEGQFRPYGVARNPDIPNAGLNVLSFLFPIIGLIMYIVWKDEYPLKAKSLGKWALIGFCVGIAIYIIEFIISMMIITI